MTHTDVYIDGKKIPGASELSGFFDKPWLRPWYAKEELRRFLTLLDSGADKKIMASQVRKWLREKDYAAKASSRLSAKKGTEFHRAVENILRGEPYTVHPELAPLIQEFLVYKDKVELKPVGLEVHGVCLKYRYGFTMDFVGYDNEIPGLGIKDWKTSNSIDDSYGLQIALYAYGYGTEIMKWSEDETWERITHGETVRLDKKTALIERKSYKDLKYLFRVAIGMREGWDYINHSGIWEEEDNGN